VVAAVGPDPLEDLTERELEVLGLMAEGRTNRAIAAELVITEHTVEKHVSNLMGKLKDPGDRRRSPPRPRGAHLPRFRMTAGLAYWLAAERSPTQA
jgi:DNA-binding CsgD family transcriptional regulator